MVAKVGGLGRFLSVVQGFNSGDFDDLADDLESIGERLSAGKELLKTNVANAKAAVLTVESLNAAFGNGAPLASSGQPAAPSASPASPVSGATSATPPASNPQ